MTSLYAVASTAAENITSQFGFPTNIPEGWFVIGAKKFDRYSAKESLESLGIPDNIDKTTLETLLNNAKNGKIEFYYDNLYLNKKNKNIVSVELSSPIVFKDTNELKNIMEKECKLIPKSLSELYGEPLKLLACQLLMSNGLPVFHHAYTVPSLGITIINETVPVNKKFSIAFVGGSGNDQAGLVRLRKTQLSLIDSLTSFMKKSSKQNQ